MVAGMDTSDETILVLGLGNILLTDEAAGVRVADYLADHPAAQALGLRTLDGGTMGMSLLVEMEDADALVVVDAAYLDQPPGSIKMFQGAEMDHFLRHRGRNPHDIGLDDLMDGLRLREAVPERRALIGIQPKSLQVGEFLNPEIAAAIPKAGQMILDLVAGWKAAKP